MTVNKKLFIFLSTHLIIWTFIPSIVNNNLPLDTIEALAWGSDLDWGFNKHPPMSAFAVELFYQIFRNQDWCYYLLSQIFVIFSFFIVFKLADQLLENKNYALLSVLLLEGIFFYNFTTPEFNVNVCQLPFWSLSVFYTWKSIQQNKIKDYILLGLFFSLGFLSKYLFIYLILAITILFIYLIFKEKKIRLKSFVIIPIFLLLLLPHFIWLIDNNYITVIYGLNRAQGETNLLNHLTHPALFLGKQLGILSLFFLMCFFLISKFKTNINFKDQKLIFLLFINFIPIFLMFLTSAIMGVKIRTMWMSPFYLFIGVLLVYVFNKNINLKKIKRFIIIVIFFFILSPITYATISIIKDNKRTDFPGPEIAYLVQSKWNQNFSNEISIIVGDEWFGGNLSYHLASRPKWYNSLKDNATSAKNTGGVIYVGNPKILKKICPGVFGEIKPAGYCMIGMR